MPKKTERVFIRGARLSFPALDEPRATMAGGNDLKYQATFLIEPSNPCLQQLRAALMSVASAMWGDRASAVLANPDKSPLKVGDNKERVPEGYAGMLYISARSKNAPELRDANPHILITDPRAIREKFVAGYKVNGFIDLYPYEVKDARGVTIKSGIAAGLVSVQFCGYADAFSGVAKPAETDYPDCSAEAEASGAYGAPAADTGYPQQSAAYPQQPQYGAGYPQPPLQPLPPMPAPGAHAQPSQPQQPAAYPQGVPGEPMPF